MARSGSLCECGQCRRYKALTKTFRHHCEKLQAPCWLCGQAIDYNLDHKHAESFSLDHRFPRSTHRHLTEDPANFMPANLSCNKSRGNRAPTALGLASRSW